VEYLPFDEADGHYPRIREKVEPVTNEPVFPLGGIGAIQILLVGESGRVYSDSIEKLFQIGDDFDSSLFHILRRDEFPKLMCSAPGSQLPWWIQEGSLRNGRSFGRSHAKRAHKFYGGVGLDGNSW
jgi:hypothetical protein